MDESKESRKADLANLKKDYTQLEIKYCLPNFEQMNNDFQIEKLADVETDFLLREIKRLSSDKFFNYFRFIESLLNPTNAAMFTFSVIKTLGKEEKDKLSELYKKFFKIELEFIEIDINPSEEKEADFIKSFYKEWQIIKKEMLSIMQVVKENWDNKSESNNKGYFG